MPEPEQERSGFAPGFRGGLPTAKGIMSNPEHRKRVLVLSLTLLIVLAGLTLLFANLLFPPAFRRVAVWAWERDEDLTFLNPEKTTVAYWSGTFFLYRDRVAFRPRFQKLKLPASATVIPVFRIENKQDECDDCVFDEVAATIKNHLMQQHLSSVQLDYDATANQRRQYKELLSRLRSILPAHTHIAVTALASWCLGDRWLPAEDVDEAIAMFFSMGSGGEEAVRMLEKSDLKAGKGIELSVGLATNEATLNERLKRLPGIRQATAIYLFSPLPWTKDRFERIEREILK